MKAITVTRSALPPYADFIEKIKPLWDSRWLTNMGTYHRELEGKLRDYLQVPYISLMVNGHMALELALQAMDLPEDSEVITTPFTFVSTTHAIIRNRLKPVFCDIKLTDYTIDETKIEALITKKTSAILPVHVYGNLCNVEKIQEIADRYGLKVLYDACHAFGETWRGTGVGNFGDVSVFSFHATKVYHTIEGGAAAFSDLKMYDRLYNLKNFGIRGEESIVEVGANAKMNEFCAIMGLCNLPEVEKNIALRREKAKRYQEQLQDEDILCLPGYDNPDLFYNYGYYPVRFLQSGLRNRVYNALRQKGIYARKYFYPLTSDAFCFKNCYRDLPLPNAREAAENILVLPLYPELEEEELMQVVYIIHQVLET